MKNRTIFLDQIINYIDTPVVKIITGVRRCGKSYLLKLLYKELINSGIEENQIITINFESLSFEAYKDYQSLYAYVGEKTSNVDKKIYLLIDEIQEVDGWENAVRSFSVDLDCDIYLTGSNADLLSGELATHLTGRYVELELYPLSFAEYLDFYNVSKKEKENVELAFYAYLKYGGFPGLYQLPDLDEVKTQYIQGIYNSIVLRDVVQRYNIRDVELLERILIYIMDNIGQIFSGKKIADYLKNQGRKVGVDSVYNYIAALENAMIIYSARRYDTKGKVLLERMEKYYLVDLGLRHSVIGYRQNDIAQLLENVIFLELKRRGYQVNVGKAGEKEIDFVAIKGSDITYIQVTYLLATKDVIDREYNPLLEIKDNHKKMVLSLDRTPIGNREGIEWHNIIDFLQIEKS